MVFKDLFQGAVFRMVFPDPQHREIIEAAIGDAEAATVALNQRIAELTIERDFYKDQFEQASKYYETSSEKWMRGERD